MPRKREQQTCLELGRRCQGKLKIEAREIEILHMVQGGVKRHFRKKEQCPQEEKTQCEP